MCGSLKISIHIGISIAIKSHCVLIALLCQITHCIFYMKSSKLDCYISLILQYNLNCYKINVTLNYFENKLNHAILYANYKYNLHNCWLKKIGKLDFQNKVHLTF